MTLIEEMPTMTGATAGDQTVPIVLMCPPEHFTVRYRINPWMEPSLPTDTSLALAQWRTLYRTYLGLGYRVELIDPEPGLPDMVYAANGGFVLDGIAYGARFAHPQRGPEAPAYERWFADNGLTVVTSGAVNEGEGDFLLVGDTIVAGAGFRSSTASHADLRRIFDREVLSLRLVDPAFYHLDTAFAVLDPAGGPASVAYLPRAFDEASQALLRKRYPDAVIATDADAAVLGLNSFSDGRHVIIAARADDFAAELTARGYQPHRVDLSELLLGGGGVKCCTLELRW